MEIQQLRGTKNEIRENEGAILLWLQDTSSASFEADFEDTSALHLYSKMEPKGIGQVVFVSLGKKI